MLDADVERREGGGRSSGGVGPVEETVSSSSTSSWVGKLLVQCPASGPADSFALLCDPRDDERDLIDVAFVARETFVCVGEPKRLSVLRVAVSLSSPSERRSGTASKYPLLDWCDCEEEETLVERSRRGGGGEWRGRSRGRKGDQLGTGMGGTSSGVGSATASERRLRVSACVSEEAVGREGLLVEEGGRRGDEGAGFGGGVGGRRAEGGGDGGVPRSEGGRGDCGSAAAVLAIPVLTGRPPCCCCWKVEAAEGGTKRLETAGEAALETAGEEESTPTDGTERRRGQRAAPENRQVAS